MFTHLLTEIAPLYALALLGFVAGKTLKLDLPSIGRLVIFVVSPVVFFLSVAQMKFDVAVLGAPVFTFSVCALLAWSSLKISRLYLPDALPNMLAMASGTNNWGYLGLPIAFLFFNPDQIAIYMMIGFGTQVFENSLGIYFLSRGEKTPWESFLHIFKFPVIYMITIGVVWSYLGAPMPDVGHKMLGLFKGAYTILGMMLIGLGISSLDRLTLHWAFVGSVAAIKFVVWPLVAIGAILLDQKLQLFGTPYHMPLFLFSLMPMAANNIAFALQFKNAPGKVSISVLVSTLFALLYIPFMMGLYLKLMPLAAGQ